MFSRNKFISQEKRSRENKIEGSLQGYVDGQGRDHGLCSCLSLKPGQSQSLTTHTDSDLRYTKTFRQNHLNGCRRTGETWPAQTLLGEGHAESCPRLCGFPSAAAGEPGVQQGLGLATVPVILPWPFAGAAALKVKTLGRSRAGIFVMERYIPGALPR